MRSKNVRKEDIEAGIALLEQQIEDGRYLLKYRPLNNKMHAAWSEETRNCLIKIYGPVSPNVRSHRVDRRGHSRLDGNAAGGCRNIPGVPIGEDGGNVEKLHRLLEAEGRQFGARIDTGFKGPSKK